MGFWATHWGLGNCWDWGPGNYWFQKPISLKLIYKNINKYVFILIYLFIFTCCLRLLVYLPLRGTGHFWCNYIVQHDHGMKRIHLWDWLSGLVFHNKYGLIWYFVAAGLSEMATQRERTFIMVKPDAVHRGIVGEIIRRFERKGFKLVAMKFIVVSMISWWSFVVSCVRVFREEKL